jgi:hypothetical protein
MYDGELFVLYPMKVLGEKKQHASKVKNNFCGKP